MTGQVSFDSHARNVLAAVCRVREPADARVLRWRPGTPRPPMNRRRSREPSPRRWRRSAIHRRPCRSTTRGDCRARGPDADRLRGRALRRSGHAPRQRSTQLLIDTNARPQLDRGKDRPWSLHFHGPDEHSPTAGPPDVPPVSPLALGSDLAGRLGVCAAPQCDRVFVDVSRNAQRRFCSPQCQSRVKAAAHRARQPPPTDGMTVRARRCEAGRVSVGVEGSWLFRRIWARVCGWSWLT